MKEESHTFKIAEKISNEFRKRDIRYTKFYNEFGEDDEGNFVEKEESFIEIIPRPDTKKDIRIVVTGQITCDPFRLYEVDGDHNYTLLYEGDDQEELLSEMEKYFKKPRGAA